MQMISIFFTLLNLSHFTNYQRKKCHLSRLDFFRVKPLVPGAPLLSGSTLSALGATPPPLSGSTLTAWGSPPSAGSPLVRGASPPQRVHENEHRTVSKRAQSPPPYPGGQEYQTKQPVATYPQQPGYPVQPSGPTTTTVVYQQPHVMMAMQQFNEFPVSMNCPYCQATIVTATDFTPGTLTWLSCGATALVG